MMKDIFGRFVQTKKILFFFCVLVGIVHAGILLYNAGTTNFYDDEVYSFFLDRQPLGEVLSLLRANIYEDAPFFDIIGHFWQKIAGYNVFFLRLISFIFWLGTILGTFFATKEIDNANSAWKSIIILMIMPYHWFFPATFKWYSLFACLSIWNFFFFLKIVNLGSGKTHDQAHYKNKEKQDILFPVLYTFSGCLMWYTNFIAPVIFFSHMLIVLIARKRILHLLRILIFAWSGIAIMFLPWLPSFINQIHGSVSSMSFFQAIVSGYILFAGELSNPFAFFISIPILLWICGCFILIGVSLQENWIPFLMFSVIMVMMLISGVMESKRLMIFSVYFAITLGITWNNLHLKKKTVFRRIKYSLTILLIPIMIVLVINMFLRKGWSTYRWTDPFRQIVAKIECSHPEALILSNSNNVFFEKKDPYGKLFIQTGYLKDVVNTSDVLLFPLEDKKYPRIWLERVQSAQKIILIYHNAVTPISFVYDEYIISQMKELGLSITTIVKHHKMSDAYMKYHPKYRGRVTGELDKYRVIVIHYSRSCS
jgi:hypothetical protein